MTKERIKIRAVAARKLLDEKLAANLTSLFAWSNFIRQFPWSSCHSSIKFHTCLVGTEMEMGKENYYSTTIQKVCVWCYIAIQVSLMILFNTTHFLCQPWPKNVISLLLLLLERNWSKRISKNDELAGTNSCQINFFNVLNENA